MEDNFEEGIREGCKINRDKSYEGDDKSDEGDEAIMPTT